MAAGKVRSVANGVATEVDSDSSALLARLQRGELGVDEYLDARVSEAIAPLEGRLPSDRLAWLRGMLREQLVADPALIERVRQATGQEPKAE
jgi:hypothetical protein